jgi:protoheme IX farnesyltransferase
MGEGGSVYGIDAAGRDKTLLGFVRSLLVLTKPGIILSVSFTGVAGMVLAERGMPPLSRLVLSLSALLLSAGGAAIMNNVLDKRIDVRMERLGKRVKALEVVGVGRAAAIAVCSIALSIGVALYFFSVLSALFIALAVLSYTPFYTLYLKRVSPYGTILGGIPGALPVLIGYAFFKPAVGADGWILFALMMLWQPPHFWALAQMYSRDYSRAGIPVLPVAFGSQYTSLLMLIYSLALVPVSLSLWFFGYCSSLYALFALAIGVYFEYVMVRSLFGDTGYRRAFGMSIVYILGIMGAVIADVLLNPMRIV